MSEFPVAASTAQAGPIRTHPGQRGAGRWFKRHQAAVVGGMVLAGFVIVALLAPFLALDPYGTSLTHAREAPGGTHWLGTDTIGRDVFSRLVWGARVSLAVSVLAVGIMIGIGAVLGGLAGYLSGWIDTAVMRVSDVIMSFPTLLIVLALVAISGQSLWNIILAIGLTGWPAVARLVRSSFLSLREEDFVTAARALGASAPRIMVRHILPIASGPLMVAATFGMASAILMESGLSFLGVGVQPPTASWGNMLTEAQSSSVLEDMPWLWLPPCMCIALIVLCINLVGDGLRDALDPRANTDSNT